MSRMVWCNQARRRLGPVHSEFGQNENGTCFCLGCSGEDEDFEIWEKWRDNHLLNCSNCYVQLEGGKQIPSLPISHLCNGTAKLMVGRHRCAECGYISNSPETIEDDSTGACSPNPLQPPEND